MKVEKLKQRIGFELEQDIFDVNGAFYKNKKNYKTEAFWRKLIRAKQRLL